MTRRELLLKLDINICTECDELLSIPFGSYYLCKKHFDKYLKENNYNIDCKADVL